MKTSKENFRQDNEKGFASYHATEESAQATAYAQACQTGTPSQITDLATGETWEVFAE